MMCSDSCKVLSTFEMLKPITRKKNGEIYQRELLRLESLTRTVPKANPKAICCDVCDTWVHIKCNKINAQTYIILKKEKASWSCIECSKDIFPFSKLNKTNFLTTLAGKNT